MTTVIIALEHGLLADRLHHYDVIIDGESYGKISAGDAFRVQLSPGKHAVKFRTAMLQSPVLNVFVGYHPTRIVGRANMWRAMGLFELFAPEDWVSIREEIGPVSGGMTADVPERQKKVRVLGAGLAALMPTPRARMHPHFSRPGVEAARA